MDLEKSWSVEERPFQLRPEGTVAGGGRGTHVGLQDQCLGVDLHGS